MYRFGISTSTVKAWKQLWPISYKCLHKTQRSEEILKGCNNVEDSSQNYLVLCAGENDQNPTKVLIEYASALKRFKCINIIVLNIINNQYLNTAELNKCILNVCRNIINCNFIVIDINNLVFNNHSYLNLTCKKINFIIDCHSYHNKYLSSKGLRDILKNNRVINGKKNYKPLPRKGTIPYYFSARAEKPRESQGDIHSTDQNSDFLSKTDQFPTKGS